MGDADAEHAVVAPGARPFRQAVKRAGDGLVEQRLVLGHVAADGVDDGLAHVAQDVGAADGDRVDHLAPLDRPIDALAGEEMHQRPSPPTRWMTMRGRVPNSIRFSIMSSIRPISAAATSTMPCFSHSSTG